MKRILKNNIFIFIYALLTVLFFSFSVSADSFSLWPGQGSIVVLSVFLIAVFFIYKKILSALSFQPGLLFIILAVLVSTIFSVASVMGVFFSADSSLGILSPMTVPKLLRLLMVFTGGFAFFYIAILGLSTISKAVSKISIPRIRRWTAFLFDKKCFIKSLIIMTVFWLPQIIVRYGNYNIRDAQRNELYLIKTV